MFNLECIICVLIIIYSVIYQTRVILKYKANKKIELKDASGLFVAKDILNKNDYGTLYVTKINGKYNDHYDIERNVIRLSEEVYDESNIGSLVVGFYESINAIYYNKNKKRKEDKIKRLILDWSNKISFLLFILGVSSKAFDVMSLSLVIMIVVIVIKYNIVTKKSELLEENINYLKKEYKLKQKDIVIIENSINILLFNELSLHLFNDKY